ncbi:hypothetical protein F4809DRAFT_490731 [Biscogniauxia mediterranea]|nr:hypothetical protein F4809DRAFT_490731 [Biscogniauxia mediterranea]
MSSSASAFAQLIPFHLKSRTIFVKCTPAPANFYERRAVLRTLQNTTSGGIETFKKLEDNSSFIAVTTKPDAATSLIQDAPLVRTLIAQNETAAATATGQPSSKGWGAEFDLRGSFTTPVNPFPATQKPVDTPVTRDLGLSQKTFTLHIFPANTSYNHREAIRRDPLHGRWPGDGHTETFISAALYRSLPANAMAPALRDWETGNQMSREGTSFAFEASEGAAATLLGKKRYSATEHFLLERIRNRWNEQEIPEVMKSLAGYAAKCGVAPEPKPSLARKRAQTPAPELKDWPSKSPAKKTGDALLTDSTFKQLLGKFGKK